MPRSLHGHSRHHRRQKFAILALRFIQLAHCKSALVSWCSSPQCAERTNLGCLFEGNNFPAEEPGTFLQGATRLWPCGELMVKGLGGGTVVRRLLASAVATAVEEGAALQRPFTLRPVVWSGGIAVRAGPRFADWGVVLKHRNSTAWFCTTCLSFKHCCLHVSALGHL